MVLGILSTWLVLHFDHNSCVLTHSPSGNIYKWTCCGPFISIRLGFECSHQDIIVVSCRWRHGNREQGIVPVSHLQEGSTVSVAVRSSQETSQTGSGPGEFSGKHREELFGWRFERWPFVRAKIWYFRVSWQSVRQDFSGAERPLRSRLYPPL